MKMNEPANSAALADSEKPVQVSDNVQFPPFPVPTDDDFDEDISQDERIYYIDKFKELNTIVHMKIHCTACDRHLGLIPKNESQIKTHPMLRTLMCQNCHSFYNSGEFEKGEDGSELYCRWCGQGGQVYCCSNCPHVFCAKCIKRNLGPGKIKVIEELDDWKCFKCNFTCLRDLRAICWAVLRYCDIKNRVAHKTEDPKLKELYLKDLTEDHSECCKTKYRRKEKLEAKRKEAEAKRSAVAAVSKLPPTIQVKKFASISVDDGNKLDTKKAQKRSASPKNKPNILMKNPISVSPKITNTFHVAPMKRVRLPTTLLNPIRIVNDRKPQQQNTFIKIRPKSNFPKVYNGITSSPSTTHFNSVMFNNDNINLSLDSLTQGLDMSTISNISGTSQDELVCTPDFPMEPLCEVTEDNTDDDVQCITPAPMSASKLSAALHKPIGLNEVSHENIVQMTENDVTVNSVTGGLKFRVDPQTLSSNKMYRLPDGRIFAINSNPNMPGGYSATIVAITEANPTKPISTYTKSHRATPPPMIKLKSNLMSTKKALKQKTCKSRRPVDSILREADLSVPVEWYRHNLIDAIDALEYSLSRLHKLKKEATTSFLRTRTANEMRNLHRSLDNLLNTSTHRFKEIRETISKEFKQYIAKKCSIANCEEDDDDDVEILPDMDDDPICIDENSLDSSCNETQEVDLTEGGSEHNDIGEKGTDFVPEAKEKDVQYTTDMPFEKNVETETPKDNENDANVNGGKELESLKSPCYETITNIDKDVAEVNYSSDAKADEGSESDIVKYKNEKKLTQDESQQDDTRQDKKGNTIEENIEVTKQIDVISEDSNQKKPEKKNESFVANGRSEDLDISDEMIADLLKDDVEVKKETSDESIMDISDDVKVS